MAIGDPSIAVPKSSIESVRRKRDLLEFLIGYGLILLVIWAPGPWQRRLYLAAVVWIVAASWRSFDGWQAMGLRRTNLLRSFWIIGAALVIAAAAIALAARFHTLRPDHSPIEIIQRFWGYAIWAFAQQFLLQVFFLQRLLRLLPERNLLSVSLSAGLFAFAHLPSPILTTVTFVLGFIACAIFLRYRNLPPLAIAHAIFGICLAITLPGAVTHNMRVGLGYLTYRPHHEHRFHAH